MTKLLSEADFAEADVTYKALLLDDALSSLHRENLPDFSEHQHISDHCLYY